MPGNRMLPNTIFEQKICLIRFFFAFFFHTLINFLLVTALGMLYTCRISEGT